MAPTTNHPDVVDAASTIQVRVPGLGGRKKERTMSNATKPATNGPANVKATDHKPTSASQVDLPTAKEQKQADAKAERKARKERKPKPITAGFRNERKDRLVVYLSTSGPGTFRTSVQVVKKGSPRQRGMRKEHVGPNAAQEAAARFEMLQKTAIKNGWVPYSSKKRGSKSEEDAFDSMPLATEAA